MSHATCILNWQFLSGPRPLYLFSIKISGLLSVFLWMFFASIARMKLKIKYWKSRKDPLCRVFADRGCCLSILKISFVWSYHFVVVLG